jgi:hypothetical protein
MGIAIRWIFKHTYRHNWNYQQRAVDGSGGGLVETVYCGSKDSNENSDLKARKKRNVNIYEIYEREKPLKTITSAKRYKILATPSSLNQQSTSGVSAKILAI